MKRYRKGKKKRYEPILIKEKDIKVRKCIPKNTRIQLPTTIYLRYREKANLNKYLSTYST